MTVSASANRITHNGDGAATAFSFPYLFLADEDLVVLLTDAAGVVTTLAIVTDYTVTGAGNPAGGTVTIVGDPPAVGEKLTILGDPEISQEVDLVDNGPFPAEVFEAALDKLTLLSRRTRDLVDRTVRLSDSDTAIALTLPDKSVRASKLLAFDADGKPLASDGTGGIAISAAMSPVVQAEPLAAAVNLLPVMGPVFNVKNAAYGAKGDGATNDSAAIQAAIDAAAAASGGTVFFPEGSYIVNTGLTVSTALIRLVGVGARRSSLRSAVANTNIITITAVRCAVENLSIFNQVKATSESALVTLGNGAVQCVVKDLDMVGGWYCLRAIAGSTDNIVKDSVMRATYGGAIAYVKGGQTCFFQRNLFNHDWPVQTPTSAGHKGAWVATTAYAVGDIVSISTGWLLQCKTAGTSGSSEPVATLYETDINDGTAVWRLANATGAASVKIDSDSKRITLEDCDMTGAFNRSLHLLNSAATVAPEEIRIIRCESSGVQDNGFDIRWGRRILVEGCEIQQAVSNQTGKSAIALFSDVEGDVTIVHNRIFASGYDNGLYIAHSTAADKGNILAVNNHVFGAAVGILADAGRKKFFILGNTVGKAASDGQANTTGIQVAAGASDEYIISENLTAGATTGISDSGTGTKKLVRYNIGQGTIDDTKVRLRCEMTDLGGTPTVTALFNVLGALSATRAAAGDYTLTWTNSIAVPRMADAVAVRDAGGAPYIVSIGDRTGTAVRIRVTDNAGTSADPNALVVTVSGDA